MTEEQFQVLLEKLYTREIEDLLKAPNRARPDRDGKHEAKDCGCNAPISGAVPETPRRARPETQGTAQIAAKICSKGRCHP